MIAQTALVMLFLFIIAAGDNLTSILQCTCIWYMVYIYIYDRCDREVGRFIGINTELWALGQVWVVVVGSLDRVVGSLHCGQTMLYSYLTFPQLGWVGCIYISSTKSIFMPLMTRKLVNTRKHLEVCYNQRGFREVKHTTCAILTWLTDYKHLLPVDHYPYFTLDVSAACFHSK